MKKLFCFLFLALLSCNSVSVEPNDEPIAAVIKIISKLGTPLEIHQNNVKTYVSSNSEKTILLNEGKAVGASSINGVLPKDSVSFMVVNNKTYTAYRNGIGGPLVIK